MQVKVLRNHYTDRLRKTGEVFEHTGPLYEHIAPVNPADAKPVAESTKPEKGK